MELSTKYIYEENPCTLILPCIISAECCAVIYISIEVLEGSTSTRVQQPVCGKQYIDRLNILLLVGLYSLILPAL